MEDLYPLSPLQEGLLFHAVSDDETQAYQVQRVQRLEGPLDAVLFRRAWTQVVCHHAILRTARQLDFIAITAAPEPVGEVDSLYFLQPQKGRIVLRHKHRVAVKRASAASER